MRIDLIMKDTRKAHRPYIYAILRCLYDEIARDHDSIFGRLEDIYWDVWSNDLRRREAYVRAGIQIKRKDAAWLN